VSNRPYRWMLQASLAFAVMATLTHALGPWCDWQLIAAVRSSAALVLTALLGLAVGEQVIVWKPATLWVRSLSGSMSMVCTFYALTRLPPSDVLTLTNMFPIWVALLSWPLLGEAPTGSVWLAVVCGVAGVVLMQRPRLVEGNLAVGAAVGASLFTAVAMLGLHRLHNISPRAIVVHFSSVAFCFCVASWLVFGHTPHQQEASWTWLALLLTGVGLTATFGQLFLTRAFVSGSPARVSVVGLTQIVFALLLDVVVLGREIDPISLAGMILVVGPTAWLLSQGHLPKG
jgi:drug/metabolite transporter (DMT)-like permease